MEESQEELMVDLMLEAQGPEGLFAIFHEDEGAGYFFVFKPETKDVLAQVCVYENGFRPSICESDVQLMWSSDGMKCGIAIRGQMRAMINIVTRDEVSAPVESDCRGITDPEWLKGFEKNYLDQYLFVRSRQRYWKEMAKQDRTLQVRREDDTPPETNFVVYAIGPKGQVGVFEDEGETGYLYLYSVREQTVVRYLHIYDRSPRLSVSREDVHVVWSEDGTKCGVVIWGKMRGVIDVASDREGRVWLESRDTPGIGDAEWLQGFRV